MFSNATLLRCVAVAAVAVALHAGEGACAETDDGTTAKAPAATPVLPAATANDQRLARAPSAANTVDVVKQPAGEAQEAGPPASDLNCLDHALTCPP